MTRHEMRAVKSGACVRAFSILVFLAGIGAIPAVAHAEQSRASDLTDVPIESLLNMEVYSASRYVQDVSDAPSAVTVLTAADIRTYGWRTLADALRSLPGLYVSYDRSYSFLGARGFSRLFANRDYNSRFLLLIDGNRANDPTLDQALIGSEFAIDIDLVDRIEYVHGPGSAVYGPNALFGVINVITKRGRDFNGWQVSGELGSQEARKGRVSYGWRDGNNAELLLSATAFYREGKDLFYPDFATEFLVPRSDGVARNLDYDRGQSVFLKGAAGPFSFSLAHAERTKGTPTAPDGQAFNMPGSQTVDEQTLATADYRTFISPGTEFYGRVFFNQHKFRGDSTYLPPPASPFDPPSTLLIPSREERSANWWGGEIKLVGSPFDRHKLVAGIEYQKNDPVRQSSIDVEPRSVWLDTVNRYSRTGVYAQDEWQAFDDLLFSLGLRYDHTDRSTADDDTVSPRLGAIYKLSPATTVKALYGKAFRQPNAYELYYTHPGSGPDPGFGGRKINPDLHAERVRSYELVLEHRLSRDSRVRLSAYRNEITDLITLSGQDLADARLYFRNEGKATAKGLEAALEQAWANGARLRASYAWQETSSDPPDFFLTDSPRHLAKLNLSLPFYHNLWRAGFEAQYVSSRPPASVEGVDQVGGYTVCNLTLLSDRLAKNLELSASVYNLFDRQYADPAGIGHFQDAIPQDGRSLRVKLTYGF